MGQGRLAAQEQTHLVPHRRGGKAIELGPVGFIETESSAYRKWVSENKPEEPESSNGAPELEEAESQSQPACRQGRRANIDLMEEQAITGRKDHINRMNPYEFQDLVAALVLSVGVPATDVPLIEQNQQP